MALGNFPFPYDIDNLLGGRARVLFAPIGTAVPGGIEDVIDPETPYSAQAGWTDFGAAKDAASYSRGFDTAGWEIQQVQGNVVEELTDLTRSISVSIAEIKPEHLQLIENAPSVDTILAAVGTPAQKKVGFGSFSSVVRYRIALISQRATASGLVTETGGGTRGGFVMGVGYQAQISADEVELELAKGEVSAANVTFTLFPDSAEAAANPGEEFGAWFTEDVPQTLT